LKGHSDEVEGVAIDPSGRLAVSASDDKTLKVWDAQTGKDLHTLRGHTDIVWRVAITSDARRAISASLDKTLKVWDLETGKESRTLKGHTYPVRGVAIGPGDRFGVSASEDGTLKLWDLDSGVLLSAHAMDTFLHSCAFSDSRTIIVGDYAGRVHMLALE
jgi:WD40 repeat protein